MAKRRIGNGSYSSPFAFWGRNNEIAREFLALRWEGKAPAAPFGEASKRRKMLAMGEAPSAVEGRNPWMPVITNLFKPRRAGR